MRKVIYSMGVSLDGFIAGRDGEIDWSADEYRLFVSPVVLGGGTPYFPALDDRTNLELVETQTFGSRVVYVRYWRV